MLKYNRKHDKSNSALSTLLSFVQIALVILGLVGVSIRLFEEKGWLQQWLHSLMNAKLSHSILIIVLVLVGGYLVKSWMATGDEKQNATADAMLYLMMVVGAYFLFNLITTGSL